MPGAVQHDQHIALILLIYSHETQEAVIIRLNDPRTLLARHIARAPPMSHAGKAVWGRASTIPTRLFTDKNYGIIIYRALADCNTISFSVYYFGKLGDHLPAH